MNDPFAMHRGPAATAAAAAAAAAAASASLPATYAPPPRPQPRANPFGAPARVGSVGSGLAGATATGAAAAGASDDWSPLPPAPAPASDPLPFYSGSAASSGTTVAPVAVPAPAASPYTSPFGSMGAIGGGGGGGGGGTASGSAAALPDVAQMVNDVTGNPLAALAVSQGRALVSSSVASYMPGLLLLVAALSTYFRVSNSYVQHKLRVLIFPFRHKPWRRSAGTVSPDGHPVKSLPMGDVMAPDLYIPLMAFVTFILATGLIKGIGYKFHPEVLSNVMSSCVVGAIIEVGVLGVWLYILSVHDVGLLDLVAYTGYKYVGLVLNACIGLALGKTAYFLSLLYTGGACAYFLINALAPALHIETRGGGGGAPSNDITAAARDGPRTAAQTAQRRIFVFVAGGLQLLLMWWLGSAGDLAAAAA